MTTTASDHYRAGKLKEAVAAATEEVKARPADLARRGFLCELLCFAGELERADRLLDAAGQLAPGQALGISLLRHLLRAEQARRQLYGEGRLPEFIGPPSEDLRLRLQASIHLRDGKPEEAAALLGRAEEARPRLRGSVNGRPFEDFRDLDDLTASLFEVLTQNGKYYWISHALVERLEFQPPEHPHDLLWRRARMSVRGGPDGEVYVAALYPGSHLSADDGLRLGRATEWLGGDGAPARGVGQRTYLAGDRDLPILELARLELSPEKS